MKISAIHIANLFDYASYQGINESHLRAHLIQSDLDVCNPENSVDQAEFLAVFKTMATEIDTPYFGLNYGCYLNIKALGVVSQISMNASSIQQAVLIVQEYLKASFPLMTLTVWEEGGYFTLQLEGRVADQIVNNHLLDMTYCFIYRELKAMLEDEMLPILELPYEDVQAFAAHLNSEIKTGGKHRILLHNRILETEINKKRVGEIENLLPKFIMMLNTQKEGYMEFSTKIRNMMLNMCNPEIPTFGQVSKQFPLSDRSIQRRLTKEGVPFRKISDDIKRELSFYLTKGKKIKTQDIAHILGYSEPSAYLHAVKRWKTAVGI